MAGPLVGDADDERDRQATVTDFLDYTEHLPSDVERSLTLLRKQDQLAQQSIEELHRLLAQYGRLPANNDAYESTHLRARISYLFDLILRRRESSAAEADRLHKEVQRHHKRLLSVKAKLQALPQPPSRDPTPQPTQKSPQAKRGEGIRINLKVDRHKLHGALPPRPRYRRVTVPGEVLSPPNPDSPTASDFDDFEVEEEDIIPPPIVIRKKERGIKVPKPEKKFKEPKPKKEKPPRLPGQMGTNVHSAVAGISTSNALSLLTPPPEDARPGSKWAPWFRLTEYEMAKLRKRMKKNAIWAPSDTMIRRELVESGRGHEAYQRAKKHSDESGESFLDEDDVEGQIAGTRPLKPGEISADVKAKTTNKGMSLNVQKKEKKEMIRQQKAALAAQQSADLAAARLSTLGESFRTLFDRPGAATPAASVMSTPTNHDTGAPKSQKRMRESGISPSAQDLQLQAQLNADSAASPVKQPAAKKLKGATLPSTLAPPKTGSATNNTAGVTTTTTTTANTTTTTTTTTTVPTAPPAASPAKISAPPPVARTDLDSSSSSKEVRKPGGPPGARRPSILKLNPPAREPTPGEILGAGAGGSNVGVSGRPETRHSSRPSSRRASVPPGEGTSGITRQSPRLKSATPGPTPTAFGPASGLPGAPGGLSSAAGVGGPATAASRRSKRPAPGPVTANQEGGAAVTVGRRKNAPKKRGRPAASAMAANTEEGRRQPAEEYAAEEDIDPNEPRYCVCDGVSYGTMVCCENPNCEREWFHLECVGLTEPPARRAKWWCPNCDPNKMRGKR